MNSTNGVKLVGDYTYMDLVRKKPFGWSLQNPPVASHFKFEVHDPFYLQQFMEQNPNLAFYIGTLYVLSIVGLRRWMRNRNAFDLKTSLVLWNLFWGIYSIATFIRSAPGFLRVLNERGFYTSVCAKEGMDIPSYFWGLVFVGSKFIQLGDTHFIIMRKRQLPFLQWYHHLATMVITWVYAPTMEPLYRWYGVLNAFSHSFVYPYLALKLMNIRVPSVVAQGITTFQLFEMVTGLFLNVFTGYMQYQGHDCHRSQGSITSFTFLFISFFILFGKLFYDSVFKAKKKVKKSVD